jgi:thiamine-phosphate pyrophosphorylase
MGLILPRLYAIIDRSCSAATPEATGLIASFARELAAAGVTLIQYRNKTGPPREILSHARELRRVLGRSPAASASSSSTSSTSSSARLIMNDRADLCLAAGFDGVHVGQDDLSPAGARAVVGPERWVGVSTHHPGQVADADGAPVDYIAVGPVFATGSKANPDPVIGLEGVRRARALTRKPLVAIGGITRANCRAVIEAGADSVAVISDLLHEPRRVAEEFFEMLG